MTEGERGMRANYYQALEVLGDQRAVPALRSAYEEDAARIDATAPLKSFEDIFPYSDYLYCCVALYRLTGAEEYAAAVQELSGHPDERVQAAVKRAMSELEREPG